MEVQNSPEQDGDDDISNAGDPDVGENETAFQRQLITQIPTPPKTIQQVHLLAKGKLQELRKRFHGLTMYRSKTSNMPMICQPEFASVSTFSSRIFGKRIQAVRLRVTDWGFKIIVILVMTLISIFGFS